MREKNSSILDEFTSVDMSADINGPVIPLESIYGFSVHLKFTGSPVGVLKMQASSQAVQRPELVTEWEDIPDSENNISGAGKVLFNVDRAFFRWARPVWVFTSGTGEFTMADVDLKGV